MGKRSSKAITVDQVREADVIRQARDDHRKHHGAERARSLLALAMARTLEERVDDAVCDAINRIEAEALREQAGTILDFVRLDVQQAVMAELRLRQFRVEESPFRVCSEVGGDAVPALLIYW